MQGAPSTRQRSVKRVVLDTASIVSAVRSRTGAAHELLRLIFRRELVAVMDLKLGLEYRQVALRSKHLEAGTWTKTQALELIEALEAFAEPVVVTEKIRPLSPDPDDDMVLDVAINARVDFLVTVNRKHFAPVAHRFAFDIISPGELLARIQEERQLGDRTP